MLMDNKKMKFIKLTIKNPTVMHGFDAENKEILEKTTPHEPTAKLISIDRIKSLCKDLVLIDYAEGRWIFWEYEENFEDIERRLANSGMLIK